MSKKLWQRLAVFLLLVAPVVLLTAYAKREQVSEGRLITAPTPIATSTPVAPDAFMSINLIGRAAIVYDLTTGQTLYSLSADRQLPLASLTKLLTIYAGTQAFSFSTPIKVSSTSIAVEGESGFYPGEVFTFRELARFALVASSNDAAEAIAEEAAARRATSTRDALAAAASAAGLSKTYATNGSGLDVSPEVAGGYGSARDVALLAGEIVRKAPEIARDTAEPSVTIRSTTGIPHTLPNTNQAAMTVPGILLSKTGYTDLAGGNLVVVFDAGIDHPVAVVVLGSTRDGRFTDVDRLIDATRRYFAGISAR